MHMLLSALTSFNLCLLQLHFFASSPMDISAPTQKFETLRHQTHGAEMSWVRSVLGQKYPYTFLKITIRARLLALV